MKGALVKLAILNFFSRHGLYFHHTKNQPPLRPPSTFSEHWPWFWPYLFSEKVMKLFWYKIWVIFWSKNHFLQLWGVFWLRNKHLLLSTFCSFQNPMEHLNLWCNGEIQLQEVFPTHISGHLNTWIVLYTCVLRCQHLARSCHTIENHFSLGSSFFLCIGEKNL